MSWALLMMPVSSKDSSLQTRTKQLTRAAVVLTALGAAAIPAPRSLNAISVGVHDTLPVLSPKPKVHAEEWEGCAVAGDGGDPALNRLKNRTDSAHTYYPTSAGEIITLPKPVTKKTLRSKWTAPAKAVQRRYEGIPVQAEGYLAVQGKIYGVREEGAESPNCHGADPTEHDWHIWFVDEKSDARSRGIVVETTPRVRDLHPGWELDTLKGIAKKHEMVRISGWLLYDQEHPEQIGKTRGTLWEIHPVMRIEVKRSGQWVLLDALGEP
jgi:hypothetical protein